MATLIILSSATGQEAESTSQTSEAPTAIKGVVCDSASVLHASTILSLVHSSSSVPGLAAAISVDGEIIWEEYLGWSDIEAGTPVTAETRFRIGSASKAVSAVVLARLWQDGRIDLDTDVRRYVPGFPDKDAIITPRLLAGHLGGIRNYEQKDFVDSNHIDHRHFDTTAEALAIFSHDPLVAPPGERYHYSVFGYTLLSAALEGAAEEDFLSLLQHSVLNPLGLQHTGADIAGGPPRATAYERTSKGSASIAEPLDFSYKWAGGGLHSSARDLARLGAALLDPGFLSPAGLKLLTTSQATNSGKTTDVAIGWRLGTDSRDRRFIHHAGSIAGGRAVILVYPEDGISVAITSNQALAPLMIESTAQLLAEPFLLVRQQRHFDLVRQVGQFAYTWTARGTEHTGILRYGVSKTDDRIDLHPELASWAARLGSPMSDTAVILPMLVTGTNALIPVVTPAGAFGIDISIGSDDSLSGVVTGQFVRVSGKFRAERIKSMRR